MCGIVGYVGDSEALPVLISGMERLEYRGYDSAGIAVVDDGTFQVVRKAGQISNLKDALESAGIEGSSGIGHTRWATHGAPTDGNAHPHRDCTGRIAIVHNGIIENFDVIKERLGSSGHEFTSETDTEVIAHLLEDIIKENSCTLRDAVVAAVKELEGAFALVCMSADEPDTIVVARQEPPIIVWNAVTLVLAVAIVAMKVKFG